MIDPKAWELIDGLGGEIALADPDGDLAEVRDELLLAEANPEKGSLTKARTILAAVYGSRSGKDATAAAPEAPVHANTVKS